MNQSGLVITEFLFAICIAFGLTILTFALTFTLSTVEVVQYVVYSASRAHVAGNFSVEAQKKAAQLKYESLINSPTLLPLFSNAWFEVSKAAQLEVRSGSGENFESDYASKDNKKNMQGVRTTFTANLLEMKLPLIGNVTPEGDSFSTRVNAIMIREVSHQECQDYMEKRQEKLWTFDGQNRFGKFQKKKVETAWEDNGC